MHDHADGQQSCMNLLDGSASMKMIGKVDGKKVAWSYSARHNGALLMVKYAGTADAGKITGNVNVVSFGASRNFAAILVQQRR